MILRTETVEQAIDGDVRGTFFKQVILTPGPVPLGMVRKVLPPPAESLGAVMLVHGFGQNRYTWHVSTRSFSGYLAAQGWDVFNIDLRGHGRSRRFGPKRPQLLEEYIREDVPACAHEALKLSGHRQLFLIGHSMGGLISYGVAATALRAETRGVISIGTPYRFGKGSRTLTAFAALMRTVAFTGALDSNPIVPLRSLGRQLKIIRPIWDSRLWPSPIRGWLPGSIENEVLDEYLQRAFDWSNVAVALDILRTGNGEPLRGHDGRRDYAGAFEWLDVPLLIIAGSHDSLAQPQAVEPAFTRSHSEDKTYRVFPLGHIDLIVGRRAPVTVWPTISAWLSRR